MTPAINLWHMHAHACTHTPMSKTNFAESMKLNNFSRNQNNRSLGSSQPNGGITYRRIKAACLVHRVEGNHPTEELMPCTSNKNWQQPNLEKILFKLPNIDRKTYLTM